MSSASGSENETFDEACVAGSQNAEEQLISNSDNDVERRSAQLNGRFGLPVDQATVLNSAATSIQANTRRKMEWANTSMTPGELNAPSLMCP